jgi:hypothetical protein
MVKMIKYDYKTLIPLLTKHYKKLNVDLHFNIKCKCHTTYNGSGSWRPMSSKYIVVEHVSDV